MIRKVITTVIISLVTLNYIQAQDKFKRELSLGASFGPPQVLKRAMERLIPTAMVTYLVLACMVYSVRLITLK